MNGANILSNIQYHPFGQPKSWTFGNNATVSRSFDRDGRLASQNFIGTIRNLGYDAASRITSLTHPANPPADQSFGYDALDRITGFTASNTTQAYNYDASGNRISLTLDGTTYPYATAAASNRLNQASGPALRDYRYDATGQITSDGTRSFTYNARQRLTHVTQTTQAKSYLYNGLGERVRKSGTLPPAGVRYFVYDNEGKLIGEYSNAANPVQETVYLNDIPVAILKGAKVYYIYADHLNAPRNITNAANRIIWSWGSDPFGNNVANEDPDGDLNTFEYNLRFPGQYHDKETNLFYNYFRDYEPATGRYVQSDPIGLAGGFNTYGYVNGNPLSYTDLLGLDATVTLYPGAVRFGHVGIGVNSSNTNGFLSRT